MKNLKIITICGFLLINIPMDHISPFLFMFIPFLFLNFLYETLSFDKDFIENFFNLLLIILLIISFFKIFETKKNWVLLSIIIQYLFLIYIFKPNFLKHWLFYLPTLIYLISSMFLIIKLFVLEPKNTNKD